MPWRPHHLGGRQLSLGLQPLCSFPDPSVIKTELGLLGLLSVLLHQASNAAHQRVSLLLDHKPSWDAPAKREVSSTPASRGGLLQPDASSPLAFLPFPLALASGQAGKILQQDPSWGCWLPAFHGNGPSGGQSRQRKILPPPSLAWAAGRYFDCIPGELGCRCGCLILGRSESVFPCVTEQAAEGWREE